MATILVVRDVLGPSGDRLAAGGHFIDESDFARWASAGWRLPLGAPIPPPVVAPMPQQVKGPADVLPWVFDWHEWLRGGDQIVSSTFIAEPGITISGATHDFTTATVTVSGGTIGQTYIITNEITTSHGLAEEHSFVAVIVQR